MEGGVRPTLSRLWRTGLRGLQALRPSPRSQPPCPGIRSGVAAPGVAEVVPADSDASGSELEDAGKAHQFESTGRPAQARRECKPHHVADVVQLRL